MYIFRTFDRSWKILKDPVRSFTRDAWGLSNLIVSCLGGKRVSYSSFGTFTEGDSPKLVLSPEVSCRLFIFTDYSSELKQFKTSDALTRFYSLPDGQTVDISSEMISTAEPLFDPETLLGVDDTIASQLPMHKLVNNAFRRSDSVLFQLLLPCYVHIMDQ